MEVDPKNMSLGDLVKKDKKYQKKGTGRPQSAKGGIGGKLKKQN
jgi:hypothetical protein